MVVGLRSAGPSTPSKLPKVLLVGVVLPGQPGFVVDEHLDELADLARSDNFEVVGRAQQQRKAPDARTFIGRGKIEEIATAAAQTGAEVVIFDDDLSPAQVKNLEEALDVAVADRSALILDIFARRAKTSEARTQVELARLNYLLPRLARRWGHLSRQVGGIGVRGGEGEKQIEADRRMIRQRIQRLTKQLEKIERARTEQRKGRRGARVVTLAGYTNAGKSTLFNRLTGAEARVEDQLFATLDAKLRRGALDDQQTAVFSDTVGFIRKLPHHLVASFRSTLGEIAEGDLVLHVVDRSHPHWQEQLDVGKEVLKDLGVAEDRIVTVYNKADRLQDRLPRNGDGVWVSATAGTGIDRLKEEILARLKTGDSPQFPTATPAP
jgi:GTP-binding protein HflX